jgi:TPR repeat protein
MYDNGQGVAQDYKEAATADVLAAENFFSMTALWSLLGRLRNKGMQVPSTIWKKWRNGRRREPARSEGMGKEN